MEQLGVVKPRRSKKALNEDGLEGGGGAEEPSRG